MGHTKIGKVRSMFKKDLAKSGSYIKESDLYKAIRTIVGLIDPDDQYIYFSITEEEYGGMGDDIVACSSDIKYGLEHQRWAIKLRVYETRHVAALVEAFKIFGLTSTFGSAYVCAADVKKILREWLLIVDKAAEVHDVAIESVS